jgi:hypothetical protein
MSDANIGETGDIRPIPDPTLLTTAALLREVARLEALMDERMRGISSLQNEKFRRVEQQFELVEQQRVEQKSDTKAAVDAALTAQKEAVKEQTIASERAIAKSEAATSKQLEQLGATFTTAFDGVRRDMDGIRERIGAIEQRKLGAQEVRAGLSANAMVLVTGLGLFVAIATVVVSVLVAQ